MKKYTRDEVFNETIKYFDNDELATNSWINKYCLRQDDGYLELTPNDMHKRLSKEFAKIEDEYNKIDFDGSNLSEYGKNRKKMSETDIFNYFKDFKYIIPQGSVMSILGDNSTIGSLSNCIVLPEMHDSYGGIFYADQQLAQLMKRRCGCGLDISTLRPTETKVSNAAKTSTGAVSFMERFSNTTREVAQNSRRGALILTIDINHPDVEYFITIKKDLKKVTGANISVKLSDEFMKCVEADSDYVLKFPVNSPNPDVTKTVRAKDLWSLIVKSARDNAEPGLIYWDTQHWYSTSSVYPNFKNISTNPCSEIAMGADSCRLISMNMFGCVNNPFTPNAEFDYEKWYEITYEAQRLNDDLVDLELRSIEKIIDKIKSDPEPEHIKDVELRTWNTLYESGKNGRRTGLGFTALADALAGLNVRYDSPDALELVEKIMKVKCNAEFDSSIDMAIERGKFPEFNKEIEDTSHFVQMLQKELPMVYDRMMIHGRRNISLSTLAPNGTVSMMTKTTSGIEPVFKAHYKRRTKVVESSSRVDYIDDMGDKWVEYDVYHPKLLDWIKINGDDISKSPYVDAEKIDWKFRVTMQSILQKYTTHSISSTVNLPGDVSEDVVSNIYMEAWKAGLKGITVYRDGSRSGVLISADKKEDKSDVKIKENNAPKRPKNVECDVFFFKNKGEDWVGLVGLIDNRPYEVFTGVLSSFNVPKYMEKEKGIIRKVKDENDGKSRYDFIYKDKDGYEVIMTGLSRAFNREYWNTGKFISAILRHGMPITSVLNLIDGISLDGDVIGTWKAGVKRMLKKYVKDEELNRTMTPTDKICEECHEESIIHEGGCKRCTNPKCGWNKCG